MADTVILLIDKTSFNSKLQWRWKRKRRVQGKDEERRKCGRGRDRSLNFGNITIKDKKHCGYENNEKCTLTQVRILKILF